MRARGIKPGFFENEHLGELSPHARLLYIGLWMLADREGRLEDRPKRVKGELFRYEPALDIESILNELTRPDEFGEALIIRYEVEGRKYIWIPKFNDHQKPHQNEVPSAIPPYEEGLAAKAQSPCGQGANRLALIPDSCSSDSCISVSREDSSLRSESSCPGSAEPDEQKPVNPEIFQGEKTPKKKAKPKPELPEDSEAYRLAAYMHDQLKASLPTLKEPDLRQWARDFDVALRNDGRMKDVRFVAQVVKWAAQDSFWRGVCQCPAKLREKFDQLTAKMEVEAARSRASPPGFNRAQMRSDANRDVVNAFVNGGAA